MSEYPPGRKKILKIPEEHIYREPETQKEAHDALADVVGQLAARNAEIRGEIRGLEDAAAHPVPGALKVDRESKVLELENELRSVEDRQRNHGTDTKIAEVRERLRQLEEAEGHPTPGALKGPSKEAEILALEDEIRALEKSKRAKQKAPEEPVDATDYGALLDKEFPRINPSVNAGATPINAAGNAPDEHKPGTRLGTQEHTVQTLEQWRQSHTRQYAEEHTVPTLEQQRRSETRWQAFQRVNRGLDDRINAFNDQVGTYVKAIGGRYNKLPWKWKVAVGAALLTGSIVSGGIGPAAFAIGAIGIGRRVLGGVGTYTMIDGLLQRSHDKKARIWNSEGGRLLISATAGILAGGLLVNILQHGGEVAAHTEEGKHVRDFLASKWPGGHGPDPVLDAMPADHAAGAALHHVDSVVAHKGMGGIKLLHGLQENLKHAYGKGPYPESVKHILEGKPEQLAKEFGFYKPDGTLDSARIMDGSKLGMNAKGDIVFTAKGGVETIVSSAKHFAGAMFDSHHAGAGLHHQSAGEHHGSAAERAALDAKERAVTAHLNKDMSAQVTDATGNAHYISLHEAAQRQDAWHQLQLKHAPKPTLLHRIGSALGLSPENHPAPHTPPPLDHGTHSGASLDQHTPTSGVPEHHAEAHAAFDTSKADVYPSKAGTPVAFGGTLAERKAAAIAYVTKHHDAHVYFDSTGEDPLNPRVPHLSMAIWDEARQTVQTPNDSMAPGLNVPIPTMEDLRDTPLT